MLYNLALQATIAVCLWILVDLPAARGPRSGKWPMALLATSCIAWVLGEWMIHLAASPDEVLLSRRVLFLGAGLLPLAWLWTAAAAARVAWLRRAPWLLLLLALPVLAGPACLFGPPNGLFTSWSARPPVHGPLFNPFAYTAWLLIGIGTGHFLLAAWRLGKQDSLRLAAIFLGGTLPVAANMVHVLLAPFSEDPTPPLLGVGAVLIRFAVIDSGLASFVPLGQRRLFDQLRSGVLVADLAGRVVDVNRAAMALLPGQRLLGRRLDELLAGLRPDGERVLELETVPLRGSLGEVGRAALVSDRTEAARMERQLVQAQKLEAIGVLTAGLAHQINDPLGVAFGNLWLADDFAKRLREPDALGTLPRELRTPAAELREILGDALTGVERIRRLASNVTQFSRPPAPERGPRLLELSTVARKGLALAATGLPDGAIRLISRPAPPVRASEEELIQIVFNLITNALEASGPEPEIEVEIAEAHGGAQLAVRDRGPGLSPEVLPHVFDPFFSTRPRGEAPGLGLSVSLSLARRHGGALEAANRPGGGAVFTLWLPAGEAQPAA